MFKHILPLGLLFFSCTNLTENTRLTSDLQQPEDGYAQLIPSKDTLHIECEEEFTAGSSCAYTDKSGKVIITAGTFDHCYSSTFHQFAYVYSKEKYGNKLVAINRKLQVIFDAYMYDNGPDYPSEGLFRIMKNGKIGYANLDGEQVIDAQYSCAFPFENGKAKVALECKSIPDGEYTSVESDKWFFIDKSGHKI